MINWNQYPFIRIVFAFLMGVLTGIWSERHIPVLIVICFFLLFYIVFLLYYIKRISYGKRWLTGLQINLLLFFLGYQISSDRIQSYTLSNRIFEKDVTYLTAWVVEPPIEKENSYKICVTTMQVADSSDFSSTTGRILMYFEKSNAVTELRYGDVLFLSCDIRKVRKPANPGEFDYARYLNRKGIYYQAYVKKDHWEKTGTGQGNPIKKLGCGLRLYFLGLLKKNGLKGKEFAVSSAILLGYDNLLDDEQKQQFAGSGAMHILCVSGLHVGILYVVLNMVLFFLDRKFILQILKVVLIICSIWSYAAITGFSPSVLRASTMFSFIVLGRNLKKKASIYNMLAASAFFLIVYDPFIITQVGFQLSYLAVTGIVLLFKPIYGLFMPSFIFFDRIWQMTAVSIAATIATFPLSLYYFNQFPNLFFVTNLIAIPAALIIVYSGLLVIIFSFIPVVSGFLAKILSMVIFALNEIVKTIEGLPFSTTTGIYISTFEMLLVFLLVIFFIKLVIIKQRKIVILLAGIMILLLCSLLFRKYNMLDQKMMVVYQVNRSTAIDFFHGRQTVFLSDSLLRRDDNSLKFKVVGNRIQRGINEVNEVLLNEVSATKDWIYYDNGFINFCGMIIVIPGKGSDLVKTRNRYDADVVVITGRTQVAPDVLVGCISSEIIVIDSSVPPWTEEKWKNYLDGQNISYHSVSREGAFVREI